MQKYRLMNVEDIGKLEGNWAEIQPGPALLQELDQIGQAATPQERAFQRRMLKLAGYDLGQGISLDPTARSAYVNALNYLILVWNNFDHEPSPREYEAALQDFLSGVVQG